MCNFVCNSCAKTIIFIDKSLSKTKITCQKGKPKTLDFTRLSALSVDFTELQKICDFSVQVLLSALQNP